MDMIWISTTMLKLPTCHLNTVKIQALRRSSSSWRHPSSVGHGLRYSMWFCVLNLGGVTNNSFMLGIVRVLSLDIVTILTYVYTIIIYIYMYTYYIDGLYLEWWRYWGPKQQHGRCHAHREAVGDCLCTERFGLVQYDMYPLVNVNIAMENHHL